MMLSGNLSDWSVGDLLQMLHITKKTASLHIEGADRSGVVYFDEGLVVNASVSLGGGSKPEPKDEVVEAVYVLQLLDEGAFEIKNEVPPRMIEPLAVGEALELAGLHLDAERQLDETGLLAARGLRLAPTIEEPIVLSEQVWSAISVSIPAFTFPELEERLGRAAAVSTVEQFRDLGILEAVLEDPEPVIALVEEAQSGTGLGDLEEVSDEDVDSHLAAAFADAWTPPAAETDDESWMPPADEANEADESWWAASTAEVVAQAEFDDDLAADGQIVPHHPEDLIQPIVADAADHGFIVPEDPADVPAEPEVSGLTPGASSLSAAIRAAAVARDEAASDDEARLLSEAAHGGLSEDGALEDVADGSLRRTVKSLVSQPAESPSGGGLGDLSARFRQAANADSED